jgi:hypothetical protein
MIDKRSWPQYVELIKLVLEVSWAMLVIGAGKS